MDLNELEDMGFMDGSADATNDVGMYQSYGLSLDDEDALSDEEKEAYEEGYLSGYQANE